MNIKSIITATSVALAAAMQAQTNLIPPLPPSSTNWVHRQFSAPSAVRTSMVVEFDYTNISYPLFTNWSLSGTNWGLATNVSCVTVSATFKIDPAVAAQFVRVGGPTYYGTWSDAANPAAATNRATGTNGL